MAYAIDAGAGRARTGWAMELDSSGVSSSWYSSILGGSAWAGYGVVRDVVGSILYRLGTVVVM